MTPADGNYWSLMPSGWEASHEPEVRAEAVLLCAMEIRSDGSPGWRLLWRSPDAGAVERATRRYGEYPNSRIAQ